MTCPRKETTINAGLARPGGGGVAHSAMGERVKSLSESEFFLNIRRNHQKQLELEAAERVAPWTQLHADDYAFRSWATNGSTELLRAGRVYELARESRKLRCLLVLINSAFQKSREAENTQEKSRSFHGLQFLSWSFQGLRYKDALLELGGWFGWLRIFTAQLADNKSFAELCKADEKQLTDSLKILPRYFHAPKAVEIALPDSSDHLLEPRILSSAQSPDARYRNVENDVVITVRIRLRDYTNKEIGQAMEVIAAMLRPSTEKELTRKGTSKRDSSRSWLDALSAMRLASYYPKTWSPGLIRRRKKGSPHATDTALSIFDSVRLGSIQPGSTKRKIRGALSQNELDRYAARARRQFECMFPFGESAENGVTWTERQAPKK